MLRRNLLSYNSVTKLHVVYSVVLVGEIRNDYAIANQTDDWKCKQVKIPF